MAGGVISPTITETVVVELVHPLAVAVMVKIVVFIVLGAVLLRFPIMGLSVPLSSIPVNMVVLSLVHEKVVPVTLFGLVIIIGAMAPPGQIVWVRGVAATVGAGFTVMVKLTGVPKQSTPPPLKTGVTVMVAKTGVLPALTGVNVGILPVPLAARPIVLLLFVQV
jgi:hypothetical protein